MENEKYIQKAVIVLSIICFVISLTQSAFYVQSDDPKAWSNSFLLFLLGWSSFLGGYFLGTIIWLANPIYIFSIFFLLFKRRRLGLYLSVISTLLAFSFSLLDSIMINEGGRYAKITSLGLGYYLWITSFIILTLGSFISLKADDYNK